MGLFRGAVSLHGGVPESCPFALMGRFPSLMGLLERFSDLNGPIPKMTQWAVFPLENPGKQPIKKKGQ